MWEKRNHFENHEMFTIYSRLKFPAIQYFIYHPFEKTPKINSIHNYKE